MQYYKVVDARAAGSESALSFLDICKSHVVERLSLSLGRSCIYPNMHLSEFEGKPGLSIWGTLSKQGLLWHRECDRNQDTAE